MKTKLFTLLFALLSASGLFARSEYDRCEYIDGLYYYLYDDTRTAEVTCMASHSSGDNYPDLSGDVVIPSSVTYAYGYRYKVTGIDFCAFHDCTGITSITIPESVTSINDKAFEGCSGLTSITIPKNVTHIGNDVFADCFGLTSVIWDSRNCDISAVEESPFRRNRHNITSFTFGNNVETIPNYLCYDMWYLTSITIPESVTSIGKQTFYGCADLTSITVAAGNIVYDSRNNCNAIIETATNKLITGCKNTIIPEDVTGIEEYAFGSCWSLTSITIPNSVTSIGERAFVFCEGLTLITIPESVTHIGVGAFENCIGLTSITIPEGITSIRDSTFYRCSSLTSITIPESVTYIGDNAFGGCRRLTTTTIPDNVTSIGDDAFSFCSFTSITIPNSVTSIGERAFAFCYDLTSITISDNITSIESGTFYDCTGLTSITIPDNVTNIGEFAFEGCTGLTSVTIPNNVTNIGESAFEGCTGLTSVTFGSSVESIEESAFKGCTNIQTITCYSTVPPTVERYGLKGVPYSTIVYVPAAALQDYQATEPWKNYDVRPIDGSAVENVTLQGMRVEAGMLVFGEPTEVSVYTAAGVCVHSGMAERLQLPSGVYTVRCGNAACKTLIP